MTRSMSEDEVVVRVAAESDVEAMVLVHRRSRQEAYPGVVPAGQVVTGSAAQSHRRWLAAVRATVDGGPTTLVAQFDRTVVGLAATELPADGLVLLGALYIDPDCWRRGVGRALVEQALRSAAASNRSQMVAWVAARNHRAKAFYFALGWWLDGGVQVRGERGASYVVQRFRQDIHGQEGRGRHA